MLRNRIPLLFPTIDFVQNGKITNQTTKKSKDVRIYRLDWSKCEEIKETKHKEWRQQHWPDCNIPWVEALPQRWTEEIDQCQFAITDNYMTEIHRNCSRAVEEWNVNRLFDTVVREMCLETAIVHVYVAFDLLADCLYDGQKQYYARDYSSIPLYAMLYRFWHHQTGRGMIWQYARLDNLRWGMDRAVKNFVAGKNGGMDALQKTKDFLYDMKVHEEEKIMPAYDDVVEKDLSVATKPTVSFGEVSPGSLAAKFPDTEKSTDVCFTATPSISRSFKLECRNEKVLVHFENLCQRIKLGQWIKEIGFEYFRSSGDVFPFVNYSCQFCSGSGRDENGKECNHPGGSIQKMLIMNPDWIRVYGILTEAEYFLEPDDELRNLVKTKQPREAYDKLHPMLVDAVIIGHPIPLSTRCISRIRHLSSRPEDVSEALSEWFEDHIFLPVAMMQNFVDEEASKESGKTVYIIPKMTISTETMAGIFECASKKDKAKKSAPEKSTRQK